MRLLLATVSPAPSRMLNKVYVSYFHKKDGSHKSMVVPDSMTHWQENLYLQSSPFLVNIESDVRLFLVVTGVKHGFLSSETFTAATLL